MYGRGLVCIGETTLYGRGLVCSVECIRKTTCMAGV